MPLRRLERNRPASEERGEADSQSSGTRQRRVHWWQGKWVSRLGRCFHRSRPYCQPHQTDSRHPQAAVVSGQEWNSPATVIVYSGWAAAMATCASAWSAATEISAMPSAAATAIGEWGWAAAKVTSGQAAARAETYPRPRLLLVETSFLASLTPHKPIQAAYRTHRHPQEEAHPSAPGAPSCGADLPGCGLSGSVPGEYGTAPSATQRNPFRWDSEE